MMRINIRAQAKLYFKVSFFEKSQIIFGAFFILCSLKSTELTIFSVEDFDF